MPSERIPSSENPTLGYANTMPLAQAGPLLREGDLLLVREGEELPAQCILCGESAPERPLKLRFSWDPSFQVTHQKATLELRRSGMVLAHLCAGHYRRWVAGRVLGVGGMVGSGLVMAAGAVLAAYSDSSDVPRWTGTGITLMIAGFACMILFLFVFALRTRTLSCQRIEGGYLYLHGAGEGFLRNIAPLGTDH